MPKFEQLYGIKLSPIRFLIKQASLETNDINEGLKTETDREQPKNSRESDYSLEARSKSNKVFDRESNLTLTNSILVYNEIKKTHQQVLNEF